MEVPAGARSQHNFNELFKPEVVRMGERSQAKVFKNKFGKRPSIDEKKTEPPHTIKNSQQSKHYQAQVKELLHKLRAEQANSMNSKMKTGGFQPMS